MSQLDDQPPFFLARKDGRRLELDRDPHPDATSYLAIETPEFLVLFPDGSPAAFELLLAPEAPERAPRDREAQLCHAFGVLKTRISQSPWTSSITPHADLVAALRKLADQPAVAEDVATFLSQNPDVASAAEMLFTSIAMSARADWRAAPPQVRGTAARGWFLGRWLPTFLVLDGPMLRFLKSPAFRRQNPAVPLLRSVRAFFDTKDFMLLRHAFAHWSFRWDRHDGESTIVGLEGGGETVRATRSEIDAFHIITFAMIHALDEVFLREGRRAAGPSKIV